MKANYTYTEAGVGEKWSRYAAQIPVEGHPSQDVYTTITLPQGMTLEDYAGMPQELKNFSVVIPGKSEPHEIYQRRIQELVEATGQPVVGLDLYAQGKSTSEAVQDPKFDGDHKLISHIDGAFLDKNGAAFATAVNAAAQTLGASHISHVFAHSTGFMAFENGVGKLDSSITIADINLLAPYVEAKVSMWKSFANSVLGVVAGEDGRDNVHLTDIHDILHKDFTAEDVRKRSEDLGFDAAHTEFRRKYYESNPDAEKIYATRGWVDGSLGASKELRDPKEMQRFSSELKQRGVENISFFFNERDQTVSASATKHYMDALADTYGLSVYRFDTNRDHAFHHSQEADGLFARIATTEATGLSVIQDFLNDMNKPRAEEIALNIPVFTNNEFMPR